MAAVNSQEPLKLVWEARHLEFDVVDQRYKIGRGAHNDIQIPDQLVSSNHAVIANGAIIDKGSTNGTFINGEMIEKNVRRQLQAGDIIMFGDTTIKVERGAPFDGAASSAAPAALPPAVPDGDSDSDEDDSVSSHTSSISAVKKQDDQNPIAWHPGVSPTTKVNGTQGAHHAADSQAASALGLFMQRGHPQLSNKMNANTARMQTERKQKEKEKKLESQLEELKHQLLYGIEQNEKAEKTALAELAGVRQQLAEAEQQLARANEALSVERKKLEDFESKLARSERQALEASERQKSCENQLQALVSLMGTLSEESENRRKEMEPLQHLLGKMDQGKEQFMSADFSKAMIEERKQMTQAMKALAVQQRTFAKQIDSSLSRLKLLVLLCICVLFGVVVYVIFHNQGLRLEWLS